MVGSQISCVCGGALLLFLYKCLCLMPRSMLVSVVIHSTTQCSFGLPLSSCCFELEIFFSPIASWPQVLIYSIHKSFIVSRIGYRCLQFCLLVLFGFVDQIWKLDSKVGQYYIVLYCVVLYCIVPIIFEFWDSVLLMYENIHRESPHATALICPCFVLEWVH
jgi:hypothetical protein